MLRHPAGVRDKSVRNSITCPNLHARANALHLLLSRHRLPACDDFEDTGPNKLYALDQPECLPPTQLKYATDLLQRLDKRLQVVSNMFAPSHEPSVTSVGPSKEDTERIKERLSALSERSRLFHSANRNGRKTAHLNYMAKFLLRPLNEILGCMLLSTGLQVFWQLTSDHLEPDGPYSIELIYAPANHPHEVIAFMELVIPHELPDSAMRILTDSLRCQLMKVDSSNGQVVIATPLPPTHRSTTCKLVGKVIGQMLRTSTPVAVVTNCNRFMVVNNPGPNVRGEEVIEFSDVVNGTDIPGETLTESPLGLLLGLTVFALHKRGLSLRANFGLLAHATTLSVLESFMSDRFAKIDKRRSHDLRLKRRAVFDFGIYPSQLGPTSLLFRMPNNVDKFQGMITPQTLESVSSMVNSFHGPSQLDIIPGLMPESNNEAWFIPELELDKWRGSGDLWVAFAARFSWLPSTEADLIVKFCNLQAFSKAPSLPYLYSRDDARIALRAEMVCYRGPLAKLQGDIVPQFYGLLGSWQPEGRQVWCALFEDAGVSLTPGDGIDPKIRAEIRRMYQKLHDHGVLHSDIAWRHMLRGAHGLKLVSFDRAIMRRQETDKEWDAKCKDEMRKLDQLLGEGTWSPAAPESDDGVEDDGSEVPVPDVAPRSPHKSVKGKSSFAFLGRFVTPMPSLANLANLANHDESPKGVKSPPRRLRRMPPLRKPVTPPPRPDTMVTQDHSPKDVKFVGTEAKLKLASQDSSDDLTEMNAPPRAPATPEKGLFKRASQLFRFVGSPEAPARHTRGM